MASAVVAHKVYQNSFSHRDFPSTLFPCVAGLGTRNQLWHDAKYQDAPVSMVDTRSGLPFPAMPHVTLSIYRQFRSNPSALHSNAQQSFYHHSTF
jgi:hypothetical protein